MSDLTLTGTIKVIGDTQSFGEKGFTKRELVVTTDEKYPQDVPLEVIKDKCDTLDSYNVGDVVTVAFNVRGREWQGKYYVNLQAWKMSKDSSAGDALPEPETATPNDDDDLPW